MELPTQILLTYGYLLLFCWVMVEQFGIPLPATPVLLAAGAMSAEHQISFVVAFLAGLLACMTADTTWFLIGRRYGHHVLRILCKLSMEPTICVRRTQELVWAPPWHFDADVRQVCAGSGNAGCAGGRAEWHGPGQVPLF